MSDELNPTRYSFSYRNDFNDKYGADCDLDPDGNYVALADVQEAIDFWNRRSTSVAVSGDAQELVQRMRAQAGRLSIGDASGRILIDAAMMIEYLSKANTAAPAEQSAPPVPPMDQSSCIPPSRAESAIPSDQVATVLDALDIAHDLAIAEQANIAEAYAGYKPHKHEAAARDVATVKAAIGIVEASRCRAQGGITNDNDINSLANQSASTASGQAEGIALTQFMAWAVDNLGQGYSLEREDGTFLDPVTRWAFAAWRARGNSAIAALSKEKQE